ncbi:hypothetical protein A2U01_0050188 [Trifolium medium]|uniref:Uncharacterized protein n=1 Tax=Trifolium medium TaxID=97028 RepID=A0A392QYM4_9FABA|nr:hypothetical protein [Trifolium medium]
MPTTTCAENSASSITLKVDTKSVDVSRKQPLSIAKRLLVEPLIKPSNMQWSFAICASLPPILTDSQSNCGFCDFHAIVIAGSTYVLAIPPKPPDLLLISKFTCCLFLPVSYIRSVERPPPKPPDIEASAATP